MIFFQCSFKLKNPDETPGFLYINFFEMYTILAFRPSVLDDDDDERYEREKDTLLFSILLMQI